MHHYAVQAAQVGMPCLAADRLSPLSPESNRPGGCKLILSQKKGKAYLAIHSVNRVSDGQVHPGAM